MPQPWQQRDVAIVLPMALVRTMWQRAEQFDVDKGGRFDVRGGCILIWSSSFIADTERAEPMGEFYVHWHTPMAGQATIVKVGWDPAEGGTEEEVWQAVELLAGQPVR